MYKENNWNYETLLRLAHYSVFSLFFLKIRPFFLRNSLSLLFCVYLKNNSRHNLRRWLIVLIFQNSWEKFHNEPLNDNLFCCFAVGLVFLGPFSSVFNVYIFVTTLVIFSRAPQTRTLELRALLFTNSVCCFHISKFKSITSIHCQRPLQKHVNNHTMLMV